MIKKQETLKQKAAELGYERKVSTQNSNYWHMF